MIPEPSDGGATIEPLVLLQNPLTTQIHGSVKFTNILCFYDNNQIKLEKNYQKFFKHSYCSR